MLKLGLEPVILLNFDFLSQAATELSENAPVLVILAILVIAFLIILMFQNRFTVKQIRIAYDNAKKDLIEAYSDQKKESRKTQKMLLEHIERLSVNKK